MKPLQSFYFLCLPVWCIAALSSCGNQTAINQIPTHQVARGPFRILHVESGEIQAVHSEQYSSPRVRGDLKITYLWPEGASVDIGTLVLQFDPNEAVKRVSDTGDEFEKAKAERTKTQAELELRLAELGLQIQQQQAAMELARINAKKISYGTPIEQEEAKISLEKSERSLIETQARYEAQKIVNRTDMGEQDLKILHREKNYNREKRDYDRLSVYAEKPGIVVYEKIRKGGRWEKVAVGDRVWQNMPIISLPDLEQMQVLAYIGEMDATQVQEGQAVFIYLEAFPGPVFNGEVASMSPMANPHQDAPNVHVFEITIAVKEQDERLKPGMSARVEIVIDSIPDVLSIPLQAVFQKAGKTFTYRLKDRSFEPVEIQLGRRNRTTAVIKSGLDEGAQIALKDPTAL